MSQAQDPPIVITGGSVTIEFNEFDIQRQQAHKFSNPNKKIRHIEIQGDGINISETIPNGKCTIRIYYSSNY